MNIYADKELMSRIDQISDREEKDYTDLLGWEGEYVRTTDSAVLLLFVTGRREWFPLSTIRKAEDEQSIYVASWLIEEKGLV